MTELPFELTALVMPTTTYSLAAAFNCLLQAFQIESNPSKLIRCRGYKNRYFEKLAEVWVF